MKLAAFLLAATIARAIEPSCIIGMYSEKQRRGLGGHFLFKVDGKPVAKLRYPTYYRIEVPPGVYDVSLGDDAKGAASILCHLIAGESCFVRARLTAANTRESALISPHEAAVALQKLIPLEPEKIYIKAWK